MSFPIDRVNYREFEPDWRGEVFFCDIDRTYLATRFSSFGSMARIPFEFAIDKQDIAGMAALLREVRRGPQRQSRHTPLYFISASPPQLRSVIERKMLMDGLEYDGTTFKDWLGVVLRGRLRRFHEQVGFKITALLRAHTDIPGGAQDVLIGDDLESDHLAYTLYADMLARRITVDRIPPVLARHGVAADDIDEIQQLVSEVGQRAEVRRAYIRLERHNPRHFIAFAPHVVAARGAFQMAVSLCACNSISAEGAVRVAKAVRLRGASPAELSERLGDSVRRALISRESASELREALGAADLVTTAALPGTVSGEWARAAERRAEDPWTPLSLL